MAGWRVGLLSQRTTLPRGPLAGLRGLQCFVGDTPWCDTRQEKESSGGPEKMCKQTQMGHRAPTSKWRSTDDGDPRRSRSAGYELVVTYETVCQLCQEGQLAAAVEALGVLVLTGCRVSQPAFRAVLKSCVVQRDLVLGRRAHALTVEQGYEVDTFLCNQVMRMYASHARLQEAMDAFTLVAEPDAFMWTSIISAHVSHGEAKQAVELYHRMRRSSVKPDGYVFVAALQACARGADLKAGQQVHADVLASGVEPHLIVCNSLVDMYAKCGRLEDARRVFDGLVEKDVVTWNALLAGYSQQGMGHEALRLYSAMQEAGIAVPTSVTFICLLQACGSVATPQALETGKQLHGRIKERGVLTDVFVANSLIDMYAKCGSLEDARRVFDGIGRKDVVTWNAMISGYSQRGMGQEALCTYEAMQEEGKSAPDSVTFACALQACASLGTQALDMGMDLHAEIRERGLQADVFVASSLVNMYAKCGSLQDAQSVFDLFGQKNTVAQNAIIAGYVQQGMGQEALLLHGAMQEEGIALPDVSTFVSLLQACATVGTPALERGISLHTQIGERGLQIDVVLGCSLVNMYAKCGSLEDAERVFDRLGEKNVVTWNAIIAGYAKNGLLEDAQRMFDRIPKRDVVTWNAMIAGYSQQGLGLEALRLYRAMREEGVVDPDSVTFVSALQACAGVGTAAREMGKQLHSQIGDRGFVADVIVANSLVNMYAKCGSLEEARAVFDGLLQKDVVTWTALIARYSQQGMSQEAIHLYSAMQKEGIVALNPVTFACLLQACANVAALCVGMQLHAEINELGLQEDVLIGGSLINMYGKCGSMTSARQVFEALPERDEVAWNALISGYACQGDSDVVFDLVHRMREDGVQPVSITFLSVLTACSHAGLVNQGREYFATMCTQYDITPEVEHYTCLVDLLGRAGRVDESLALVRTMPVHPSAALWHSLLGACRKWGNVKVGLYAFHEAVKLDERDTAAYVLMSNIYTSAKMWEQAQEVHARRKAIGAWKQPGQSWWTDKDGVVHRFLVGDKKHPEAHVISERLKDLVLKIKEQGYVLHLDSSHLQSVCLE